MISDSVWNEISKLMPEKKTKVGRPPQEARVVLSGVFYVIITGAQWHQLPDYYGRPTTVHGRFRIWVKSGVFEKILHTSIDKAVQLLGCPESFLNDTSSVKAPLATFGGKNPTDRRKRGIKKGIVIDWNQIVLSVLIDAANKHDSKLLIPHIQKIKRFLNKPKVMTTDSAWDVAQLRKDLAKENLVLHASTNVRRNKKRRKIKSGGRWKIEQVFGMQQWNRGIKFCWTKTKESFLALCQFSCSMHNFKLAGIFG